MANEYTYNGVSVRNSITGETTFIGNAIEPDIFSSVVKTETYTITEADVLAALNNNGNLPPKDVQVSCSGDRGTIVVDNSRNYLNVYAPNLIASYYEPFASLAGEYRLAGYQYAGIGETINYTWKVTNLSKTIIPSLTLTSALNGAGTPFSLTPNEIKEIALSYVVTEDDIYNETVTEAGTISGTSFAGTPIEIVKPLVMYVASLKLQASLTYTDSDTGLSKRICTLGDVVSYTATIANTGSVPLYNLSFYDARSGQTETIAKLNPRETRSFNYSIEMTVSPTAETVTGTLTAQAKQGSNKMVNIAVVPLKCYVDLTTVGWAYKVRVDSNSNLKSSIPFSLYNQSISLDVDWGDGTSQTLTSANFATASSSTPATHQYATAGEYTIVVDSSDWSNTYICSYGTNLSSSGAPTETAYCNIGYFRMTLIEILNELPSGLKGTCYYASSNYSYISNKIGNPFQSCTKLTAIPDNLFSNITTFTSFAYCFSGCSSLTEIPSGLFDNCGMATSFNYCFSGCTSLTEIPSGLFDDCSAATTFQNCFYGCSSLTAIPDGLFDNCTLGATFWSCFQSCSSLVSIPENLFALNTKANDFDDLFSGCSALGDFTLHVGTRTLSYCSNFVTKKSGTTRIVYVPSGSATQTKFNSVASNLGLTVIGE